MGSFVSRFGLVFYSETGAAERGLGVMSRQLDMIQSQLASMGGVAERAASQFINVFASMGKTLVGTSAKMEATKAKFEFAFRAMAPEEVAKRWQAVEVAGLKTVQSTNDVAESMALLQSMTKADVFGDKALESLKKAAPALTNFGELFGDIASSAQFGTRSALWGLKALLQGEYGSAGKHLDSIGGSLNEYKKAAAGAKNESERLIKFMPLLVRDFGGASAKMGTTFNFLVDQLGDIQDKFYTVFGKGTMDQLKGPLKAFIDIFVGEHGLLLPANIKVFDQLQDIFDGVGGIVSAIAGELVTIIESLVLFFTSHPQATKFALAVAAVGAALSGLIVVLLAAKAIMVGLVVAFSGWTIPLMLAVTGIGLLAYQMLKLNLGAKSAMETWENLKLVFGAVNDLVFSTAHGFGELDEKTVQRLANKGLLNVVVTIGKLVYRIREFFGALWWGLKNNFDKMKEAFMPVMERISRWLGGVGDAAGGASSQWRSAGIMIADALTKVVQVMGYIIDKVAALGEFLFKHKTLIMGLLAGYGIYKAGGFIKGVVQKAAGGGEADPGGPTQRVFVVNWPGGGFGGGGGALPGVGGGAAGGGIVATVKGAFAAAGTEGLMASAAGTAAAAAATAASWAAWTVFTTSQLFKSGWNDIKQLTADDANQLAAKAKKAEEEAPSHLSSGMMAAMEAERRRLEARRAEQNRGPAPMSVVLGVHVDGTKAMEKKIELNADRTGQGGAVNRVP